MTTPPPSTIQARDIVCVGFADWQAELWTNQQHLMSRLGADNRVLFIESLGLRKPQVNAGDGRRIIRRLRNGLGGSRKLNGVDVLSPLVVPFHGNAVITALNERLLARSVRRATRKIGMKRPILWAYVPQAEALIETLDPEVVIYHCVDDIAAQKGVDGASFREAENRFARRADLVIASAPSLAVRMRTISDNVIEAPNVADTALFSTALENGPIDPGMASLREPRLVFIGAITATKLDLELLSELARIRPEWNLALVGPVGLGDPSTDIGELTALPNVHALGPRRHSELPAVLRGAAVGLIPYRRSQLTASIFPMKVYEYLAAGLPVVSTPLPALDGVIEIASAANAEEMAARIEEALRMDGSKSRADRSLAAADHSWEARLVQIAEAIQKLDR